MDNPGISLFQANTLNLENPLQNQEEEDLEEQKKRQEEIQNFLTTAMDEFNYDDQSTVNSSENVSVDDTYNNQSVTMQKYKNASLDDQLKVLYEIRVKEVKSLMEQLAQLKMEIQKQKETNGKTSLLLEAEKDRAKVTSQQAQMLLVNKTEEISKLKHEIDTLRATVLSLETTVKAVNDEYTLCKQSNNELIEQLALMHNGLTTNTISDRQLQEQHHAEVSRLHHLLDSAHMKLHRKEKEFKELEQKLKETVNDKDILMAEKSSVINQLTQNLENALDRCQEFSQLIDKVSQENKTLKLSTTTNDLTESIRTMGLADKTEIVKALQRELEKSHVVQSKQQNELEMLREGCDKLTKECSKYEINDERHKNELEMWKRKYAIIEEEFANSKHDIDTIKSQLEEHRNKYEFKIKLLQESLDSRENKENCDNSVQVSGIADDRNFEKENQKLKSKIDTLNNEMQMLSEKLADTEAHLSQMKLKISLEKEREALIKSLQEKAAKFEEIIKERKTKPDYLSVGVNTDNVNHVNVTEISEQVDLLKTKYETDLVQKEIEIRTEVKRDFDLRLEKVQKNLSKKAYQMQMEKNCDNCKDLLIDLKQLKIATDTREEEIDVLKQQMKQDRDAVATLLEEWSDRFVQMEDEKQELHAECATLKEACDQLLRTKEAGDTKVYEVIKKECEETIKMWNKNTLDNLHRYALGQQTSIKQSKERIEDYCNSADMEVQAIEAQYSRKMKLLQQNMTQKRNFKYRA